MESTIQFQGVNPYFYEKRMAETFPDLPETAAEEMLGELRIGEESRNGYMGRHGFVAFAGPAESQILGNMDNTDNTGN